MSTDTKQIDANECNECNEILLDLKYPNLVGNTKFNLIVSSLIECPGFKYFIKTPLH